MSSRVPGLHRRGLIVSAGAAFASPAVLRAEAASETVVVETADGRLRGERAGGVNIFRGVPYGGPVSGAARFKPARRVEPWAGVRDALRLGAPSFQDPGTVYGRNEPAPAEDCLFLNVWAPASGGAGKPVMFYCHGGGFTTGSGGSTSQDGANLARENDVVVVSTNHRLGLLGYLYLADLGGAEYAGSGNQGLSDIVLGLDWVRRNIRAFGGDPGNVMIFGESGGGAKVSCLYAAPAVAPLFHKAAIQSGPAVRIGERETAARTTRMLLDELQIAPADWRRLLEVPAPALFAAQNALARKGGGGPPGMRRGIADFRPGEWGPIVDGALLPSHPFDPAAPASARDKPLIVGGLDAEAAFFAWSSKDAAAFNLDEAGLRTRLSRQAGPMTDRLIDTYRASRPGASPSDLFFAILTEATFGAGGQVIAERKAAQSANGGGAPVYVYNLAYRSDLKSPDGVHEVGAMHAIDIPLVFDNVQDGSTLAGGRADRIPTAKNMSRFWASFARTGRPSAPGQPAWPAYDLKRRQVMVIDAQCRVVADRYGAERRLFEQLDPSQPPPAGRSVT